MNQKVSGIEEIEVSKVRNISIISHVDHGKTTLTDYLLASGGLLPEFLAGTLRALDALPEEQRRGITIETSLATYQITFDEIKYKINLIDTPGHVDFSGKVAESLRLVDGSIIVVDCVEGIMAQTKSVLKQAIRERISFVLFINKLDRLINELELDLDQIQIRMQKIIGDIQNMCINLGMAYENLPNFSKGTILMGSALDGWVLDIDFVKAGNTLQDIITDYNGSELRSNTLLKLSSNLNKSIVNLFPDPIQGQKNKFPSLLKTSVSSETLNMLTNCDKNGPSIILIGRQERIERNTKNSYTCRILSGIVKKGDQFISSLTQQRIKVINVSTFEGRSKKSKNRLIASDIGSISFSDLLTSGDVLLEKKLEKVILDDIAYIQDPVVAISIEPLKINQIAKLQRTIEEICQYTPGMFFELIKQTGELVVQGVGTLQLDVLINDLISMNYDIEASPPIIISYEIPLIENQGRLERYDINFIAGNIEDFTKSNEYVIELNDEYNNWLFFKNLIPKEGLDGCKEVFKQFMKISPLSGKKIKSLYIIIDNPVKHVMLSTYENAMIFGSKLIKEALIITNSAIHEPYYDIELQMPEAYIGTILQELQRINAIIVDVVSDLEDSMIKATISVHEALRMADKFRQLSDGNAFWSFPSIQFLPLNK